MSMRAQTFIVIAAIMAFGSALGAEPTQTASAASEGPAVNTSPGVPTNSKTQKPKQSAPAANNTSSTGSTKGNANRADRLNLDTTVVTGNRELPKVLYIVPWKKADIGDLPAQPFNTLLDEVLTPVDRDVFRREVTYYGAVSAGANAANSATPAPAPGTEK